MVKRIDSLQGLRAVAFLAIFTSHTQVGSFEALGAWGVSIFFCLSGFLMIYNYLPREEKPKFGFSFAWSKIKKLYPLHIATMLTALLFEIVYMKSNIGKSAIDAVLHIFLLQVWIPVSKWYSTLNGVSWYLCVCAFMYLCFPLVLKFFAKQKKREVRGGVLYATPHYTTGSCICNCCKFR